jgi:gas vesicle protein
LSDAERDFKHAEDELSILQSRLSHQVNAAKHAAEEADRILSETKVEHAQSVQQMQSEFQKEKQELDRLIAESAQKTRALEVQLTELKSSYVFCTFAPIFYTLSLINVFSIDITVQQARFIS